MCRGKGVTDDIPDVALLARPPLLEQDLVCAQDLLELGQVRLPLLHCGQRLGGLSR